MGLMKLIIAIAVILAAVAGMAFITRDAHGPDTAAAHGTLTIESGSITLVKDGITSTAINGQALSAPLELLSDATGRATVHFADGSELRIDHDSKINLESGSFNHDTKDLSVSVFVHIGRVWSNIVSLATPASSWEVETSNVVATVRGTAFGVTAEASGTTTLIGSENTVTLTMKDASGNPRPEYGGTLESGMYAVITNDMQDKMDTNDTQPSGSFIATNAQTDDMRNDEWVRNNETRDGTREPEADDTLIEVTTETDTVAVPEVKPVEVATPQVVAQPVTLTVTPSGALNGIVEGSGTVRLTATLTFTDGTKKDVTNAVTWQVIGAVGSMQNNVFTPLLAPSVSELGRAPGSIAATWRDPATRAEIVGSTPAFEVKAKIIQLIPEG
jgi:hypothetical protein